METMEAGERCRYDEKVIDRKRKFSNLRKKRKSSNGKGVGRSTADQIELLEINVPRVIKVDGRGECTVTALDANHCPGSCMYVVLPPDTGFLDLNSSSPAGFSLKAFLKASIEQYL